MSRFPNAFLLSLNSLSTSAFFETSAWTVIALPAGSLDVGGNLFGVVLAARVVDDHVGSFFGEGQRDAGADALGSPRYDSSLAC